MEIIDKIKKVIEMYYLENNSSLYIPESVVNETIHLICEKASSVEHFCVYNKDLSKDLLYTGLSNELLVNKKLQLKQYFAVMNVRQLDCFLSKRFVSIEESKVDSNVILLSNISIEKMPSIFDFIVFDKKIVLALDNDNDGGYYLSTESKCLVNCQKWLDVEAIGAKEFEHFFLQEPLMKSANMMSEVASVLCSHDHFDSNDCYWYHSSWQYLRLMNLVSTPSWHHDFYLDQIRQSFKENEEVKVLISGAADYSSLSYVVRALEDIKVSGIYSVLDLCETPLFSCKWFANFKGISVKTMHQSIFNLESTEQYDLICTDAFLTRFLQDEIADILSIWNNALCKNGHIITTVRIHDHQHPCPETPSDEDVKKFIDKATERMKIWGGFINCTVEEIYAKAKIYAKKMHSNHVGDEKTILKMFEDAGFTIVHTEDVEIEGELYPSRYLRINAMKSGELCEGTVK